jgi:hypothetical protein
MRLSAVALIMWLMAAVGGCGAHGTGTAARIGAYVMSTPYEAHVKHHDVYGN